MSFFRMGLLGPYSETENENQHALTVVCMLINYVFMIPIKSKTTEDIINAYLTNVYSMFRGNKYILSARGSEFTWLAQELGFIKVYTSPYCPTSNSVIERTHTFLKASLGKHICNHNTNWNDVGHIAALAFNVFLHSSSREAPFYLMFGCDASCQHCLNYYG